MEFQITSSPHIAVIFSGVIAFITLGLGLLFLWFAYSTSNLSTTVEKDSLHLHVPIYGRTIPLSSLDLNSAQVANLNESPELKPRWRTNGIGIPGYAVGWFKLRNGDKALAAVTSKHKVLYMKTTEGYSLLLSLERPEQFLDRLSRGSSNG